MRTYLISELTPEIVRSGTHLVLLEPLIGNNILVNSIPRDRFSQLGDDDAVQSWLNSRGWHNPSRAYPANVTMDGIVPVEAHAKPTHVWRFEGEFDLPDGQPQHGDISLTERNNPDGWRALKILAKYEGPFIPRLNRRRQWLLCEDGEVVMDSVRGVEEHFDWFRNMGCAYHWSLKVEAGNEYHRFTLQECLQMPVLLDALEVYGLEVMP